MMTLVVLFFILATRLVSPRDIGINPYITSDKISVSLNQIPYKYFGDLFVLARNPLNNGYCSDMILRTANTNINNYNEGDVFTCCWTKDELKCDNIEITYNTHYNGFVISNGIDSKAYVSSSERNIFYEASTRILKVDYSNSTKLVKNIKIYDMHTPIIIVGKKNISDDLMTLTASWDFISVSCGTPKPIVCYLYITAKNYGSKGPDMNGGQDKNYLSLDILYQHTDITLIVVSYHMKSDGYLKISKFKENQSIGILKEIKNDKANKFDGYGYSIKTNLINSTHIQLLVSAPYYSDIMNPLIGRIFIYFLEIQDLKKDKINDLSPKYIYGDKVAFNYFGINIEIVPSLKEGIYDDYLISSPFKVINSEFIPCIYVYYGSINGINDQFEYKIQMDSNGFAFNFKYDFQMIPDTSIEKALVANDIFKNKIHLFLTRKNIHVSVICSQTFETLSDLSSNKMCNLTFSDVVLIKNQITLKIEIDLHSEDINIPYNRIISFDKKFISSIENTEINISFDNNYNSDFEFKVVPKVINMDVFVENTVCTLHCPYFIYDYKKYRISPYLKDTSQLSSILVTGESNNYIYGETLYNDSFYFENKGRNIKIYKINVLIHLFCYINNIPYFPEEKKHSLCLRPSFLNKMFKITYYNSIGKATSIGLNIKSNDSPNIFEVELTNNEIHQFGKKFRLEIIFNNSVDNHITFSPEIYNMKTETKDSTNEFNSQPTYSYDYNFEIKGSVYYADNILNKDYTNLNYQIEVLNINTYYQYEYWLVVNPKMQIDLNAKIETISFTDKPLEIYCSEKDIRYVENNYTLLSNCSKIEFLFKYLTPKSNMKFSISYLYLKKIIKLKKIKNIELEFEVVPVSRLSNKKDIKLNLNYSLKAVVPYYYIILVVLGALGLLIGILVLGYFVHPHIKRIINGY